MSIKPGEAQIEILGRVLRLVSSMSLEYFNTQIVFQAESGGVFTTRGQTFTPKGRRLGHDFSCPNHSRQSFQVPTAPIPQSQKGPHPVGTPGPSATRTAVPPSGHFLNFISNRKEQLIRPYIYVVQLFILNSLAQKIGRGMRVFQTYFSKVNSKEFCRDLRS